MLEKLGFAGNY